MTTNIFSTAVETDDLYASITRLDTAIMHTICTMKSRMPVSMERFVRLHIGWDRVEREALWQAREVVRTQGRERSFGRHSTFWERLFHRQPRHCVVSVRLRHSKVEVEIGPALDDAYITEFINRHLW